MKIVNFVKHEKPILCHFNHFQQTHSFDIEIPTPAGSLIWVGWGIIEHLKGKNIRLQGPLIYNISTKTRSPAIILKGREQLVPILIRQMLKEDHGIDIPPPTPRPPRTAPKGPKIEEKPKVVIRHYPKKKKPR
jgi:hypothetical protein